MSCVAQRARTRTAQRSIFPSTSASQVAGTLNALEQHATRWSTRLRNRCGLRVTASSTRSARSPSGRSTIATSSGSSPGRSARPASFAQRSSTSATTTRRNRTARRHSPREARHRPSRGARAVARSRCPQIPLASARTQPARTRARSDRRMSAWCDRPRRRHRCRILRRWHVANHRQSAARGLASRAQRRRGRDGRARPHRRACAQHPAACPTSKTNRQRRTGLRHTGGRAFVPCRSRCSTRREPSSSGTRVTPRRRQTTSGPTPEPEWE